MLARCTFELPKTAMQAVIDAQIIPPLIYLLASAEFDIQKEAAWAISNATSGGSHDQIKYLVYAGCIKPLCDLLDCGEVKIVKVAMEGLENILKVWPRTWLLAFNEGSDVSEVAGDVRRDVCPPSDYR